MRKDNGAADVISRKKLGVFISRSPEKVMGVHGSRELGREVEDTRSLNVRHLDKVAGWINGNFDYKSICCRA